MTKNARIRAAAALDVGNDMRRRSGLEKKPTSTRAYVRWKPEQRAEGVEPVRLVDPVGRATRRRSERRP